MKKIFGKIYRFLWFDKTMNQLINEFNKVTNGATQEFRQRELQKEYERIGGRINESVLPKSKMRYLKILFKLQALHHRNLAIDPRIETIYQSQN